MGLFEEITCGPKMLGDGMQTPRFSFVDAALLSCKLMCHQLKLDEIINKLGVKEIEPVSESLGNKVEPDEIEELEINQSGGECVIKTVIGGHSESVLRMYEGDEVSQGPTAPTLNSPQKNEVTHYPRMTIRENDTQEGEGQDNFIHLPQNGAHHGSQPNRGLASTRKGLGRYEGPTVVALLKNGTLRIYDHDGEIINEGAAVQACVPCAGLMSNSNKGFKPHNFTPHFHHYMLIRLMTSHTHLGAITYKEMTLKNAGMFGNNLRAEQVGCKHGKEHEPQAKTAGCEVLRWCSVYRFQGLSFVVETRDLRGCKRGLSLSQVKEEFMGVNVYATRTKAPKWTTTPFQVGEDATGVENLTFDAQGNALNPTNKTIKSQGLINYKQARLHSWKTTKNLENVLGEQPIWEEELAKQMTINGSKTCRVGKKALQATYCYKGSSSNYHSIKSYAARIRPCSIQDNLNSGLDL